MPTYLVNSVTPPLFATGTVNVNALNIDDAKSKALAAYKKGAVSEWVVNGFKIFGVLNFPLTPSLVVKTGNNAYNVLLKTSSAPAYINQSITSGSTEEALEEFNNSFGSYFWNWRGIPITTNSVSSSKTWATEDIYFSPSVVTATITTLGNAPAPVLYVGTTYKFKINVYYLDSNNVAQPADGELSFYNGASALVAGGLGEVIFRPTTTSKTSFEYSFIPSEVAGYKIGPIFSTKSARVFKGTPTVNTQTSTVSIGAGQVFPIKIIKSNDVVTQFRLIRKIGITSTTIDQGLISEQETVFNISIPAPGVYSIYAVLLGNNFYGSANNQTSPSTVIVT